MPLTLFDFVQQVNDVTVEDIPDSTQDSIDSELADQTSGDGGGGGTDLNNPGDVRIVADTKSDLNGRAGFISIEDAINGDTPKNTGEGESPLDDPVDTGGVITVEPGTYEESITVNREGVTLTSTQGPEQTKVDAGPTHGSTGDTSNETNTGAVFTVEATGVTIDGFEITNPDGLIGIKIEANKTTVLDNEIRNIGPTEFLGVSGIATDPGSFNGIDITGNTIENLKQERGEASQFRPTVNGILFDADVDSDTLSDTNVENNTIRDLRSDIAPIGIVLQQQLTDVAVENNELSDIIADHESDSNDDEDKDEVTTFAQGINIAGSSTTNAKITGNVIAESVRSRDGFFGESIKIDGSDVSGLSINNNDLLSPFALTNAANGSVDATDNFFNSQNGPNTDTNQNDDPAVDTRPSAASVVLGPADTIPFRASSITTSADDIISTGVRFNDQSSTGESVTVDRVEASDNEDFVLVAHRSSPGDEIVDGTSEIGNKIGSSGTFSGSSSGVTVDLTKNLDEENTTGITETQTLITMLHNAKPNASGDKNFGGAIKRNGTPVFDQAEITID